MCLVWPMFQVTQQRYNDHDEHEENERLLSVMGSFKWHAVFVK